MNQNRQQRRTAASKKPNTGHGTVVKMFAKLADDPDTAGLALIRVSANGKTDYVARGDVFAVALGCRAVMEEMDGRLRAEAEKDGIPSAEAP
jgi:hypothetical protein